MLQLRALVFLLSALNALAIPASPAEVASSAVSSKPALSTTKAAVTASSSKLASSGLTASSSSHAALPKPSGSSNSTNGTSGDAFVAAYWLDWQAQKVPADKTNFDLLSMVNFAFTYPDEKCSLIYDDPSATDGLKALVEAAKAADKKVSLTVGGWKGSQYFSDCVKDDDIRTTFVKNIVDEYNKYEVGAIEIDWEYPGKEGVAGNKVSPQDLANYIEFLTKLRGELPEDALISAATSTAPYNDESGNPSKDMSKFGEAVDYILIMNYDASVGKPQPGPNAFVNSCPDLKVPENSAEGSVKAWSDAGFPKEKMVLGLAAYGYKYTTDAKTLTVQRRAPGPIRSHPRAFTPRQESAAASAPASAPAASSAPAQAPVAAYFAEIVKNGSLKLDGDNYVGDNGFKESVDECSGQPFIVNEETHELITYDDPKSLAKKAAWAKEQGLKGVGMWDLTGELEDYSLLKAARTAFEGADGTSNSTTSASGSASVGHHASATKSSVGSAPTGSATPRPSASKSASASASDLASASDAEPVTSDNFSDPAAETSSGVNSASALSSASASVSAPAEATSSLPLPGP